MADPWRDLEADLARAVEGEVRFDRGTRAVYATDASNHRQVPIGVVTPRTKADVVAAVEACRAHGAPILSRGAGTSLAGQGCNAAVVLDFTRHLGRIVALDPDARTARVEPGVVLDDLQRAAAPHGLRFGPDPATHASCTIGGMIGNDACGVHSVLAGRTSDNVASMEVLTYDGAVFEVGPTDDGALSRIVAGGGRRGEIHARLRDLRDRRADAIRAARPAIPRAVSGYGLEALLPERGFDVARSLVGSEGTLATVLEATVRLIEWPPARRLLLLGYPDVFTAADHVPAVLEHGPIGLEGLDTRRMRELAAEGAEIDGLDLLPESDGWLVVEFGGDTDAEAAGRARRAMAAAADAGAPAARLCDPVDAARAWGVRETGLRAVERARGSAPLWPGWEDSAVRPDRLADYLRDLRGLLDAHGLETTLYGHFGDGCVHARISFDLDSAAGVDAYRRFLDEAADLCCGRYGGSLSGEHGDGIVRGALLERMFGAGALAAMREAKTIWDPDSRMNPGRVVEAAGAADHLRPGLPTGRIETAFDYPEDGDDFGRAVARCAGIGRCRRTEGGTMCPSYRATREEKHSTRGRARILQEMLRGDTVDGWGDEAVLESLDLCLGCKACRSECPVSVDMARYKAEFLARHWAGRIRPRAHYAMGLVPKTARWAARAPRLANRVIGSGPLSRAVKRLAGVAPERELPRLAEETFRSWFRARARARDARAGGADRPEVVLFPDTFHDLFRPRVARAAVEVLEACGWRVTIPDRPVCCGRPMIHYGMLGRARRELSRTLDALRPALDAGTPIVGLEPSCVAAFRDEAPDLLDDPDANRLAGRVRLFGEFAADGRGDGPAGRDGLGDGVAGRPSAPAADPGSGGRALLHLHCHQAAVLDGDADRRFLERLGFACETPETGCCGMAGSFGYERGTHAVSVACAEAALVPAVRAAGDDVTVVTSGYSCAAQIAATTGRRAYHPAEVARAALRGEPLR